MTERSERTLTRLRGWKAPRGDASQSALLAAQALITFVAIPLSAVYPSGHALLDIGHLAFAAVLSPIRHQSASVFL